MSQLMRLEPECLTRSELIRLLMKLVKEGIELASFYGLTWMR